MIEFDHKGDPERILSGWESICRGEVGCIVIAGGQATRLQASHPKGMIPLSPIKHKSLFQLFAEKTVAASQSAGKELPLAIMLSEVNAEQVEAFFADHHRFGLSRAQLSFFVQGSLPLLNREEQPFFDREGHLATGPDGNGALFACFLQSGLWQKWFERGVKYVQIVLVDNPLADPFDAEMIGYQKALNADMIIKSIERGDPEEKVGVLVQSESGLRVVEYSELSDEEKRARNEKGKLKHSCANISLFSFSISFLRAMADVELPLHRAFKISPYLDAAGRSVVPQEPNAWKQEKFIFDALEYTSRVGVLIYPREECFAPLKNATGKDSIADVQRALQRRDRQILQQLTGHPAPEEPLEISQEFYYPNAELRRRWHGKRVMSGGYLE